MVLRLRLFFFLFPLWIKQTKGCTACVGRLQSSQAASHWNKEKRLCLKTSYSNKEHTKLTAVLSTAYHD